VGDGNDEILFIFDATVCLELGLKEAFLLLLLVLSTLDGNEIVCLHLGIV
jgi:hypothetical protein